MKPGQILVELMLAMGMLAIFLPALTTGLITSSSGKVQTENRQEATLLLQEELESLDVVRNAGWTSFATDGIFHTTVSGNTWILTPGVETVSTFTRQVEISPVSRNNGAIVTSGGTIDPSTKKITVTVSWVLPYSNNVTTTRYFTRYHDNLSQADSTQAQFDLGTKNSVATTNVSGGEVVLSGGGHGDWCQPALTQWNFNLNHNASGTAIYATASATFNSAFVVTGDNSASETFYDVNISNTYPPIATNNGNLTGQKKAYGVFGDHTYAYIATDTGGKQGVIIQLSNHQEIGWLDAGAGNVKGRSIVIYGNYAYLSANNNKIYIFDISTKTGTKTPISSVTLTATAVKIVINGSNLYAALNAISNQLAIIPINGGSFGTPIYVTVPGQNGRDIFLDSTSIFLATSTSASQAELFVIDPVTRLISASQDTSGMDPQGVAAVTNNKVIIVGSGGFEYQVYNYSRTTKSFSTCTGGAGYLNIDTGIRSLATVLTADYAYSYIVTGDSAAEFKIIEGGPNGSSATSGTYTSSAFDAGHSTAFNRFSWTADVPGNTTVQFQVAVADPVSGSCTTANYLFVGPDGTAGTYFTVPAAMPLNDDGGYYQNPGQCFKYKAYLSTTDVSTTPTLFDVTWGFSP